MSNGARKPQDLLACVEYEHRKKDGTLVSKGKQIIDRHRRTHFIQEDSKGKRIGEAIFDRSNKLIEVIEGDSRDRTLVGKFMKAFKVTRKGG